MLRVLLVLTLLSSAAACQLVAGSMDVRWNEGAPDCAKNAAAPIQVHPYNPHTFILRESLCATFEAPFVYLLMGSSRALLIDTGDVAEPAKAPLAETVMHLIPGDGPAKLPLLVVHTHRHLDHRAGDGQFAHLANVEVVGFDIESVRRFFHFTDWPNGVAQLDLGNRVVDVIPTPGHNETEISFYDRNTELFFSGDFLLPGRLLIDNTAADLASAERVARFVRERPVSYVLGGHIEMNAAGETFAWGSQYHPNERALAMSKDDLLSLPTAVAKFNSFYTKSGGFVLMNPVHTMIALAVATVIVLIGLVWMLVRWQRKRAKTRRTTALAETSSG